MRKNNQTGRSMVEMLGVLAIIGVLSVGAIAGYQKAMFKYKLNKHAESFNLLLNNALQYTSQMEGYTDNGNTLEHYAPFFFKANLIPDGMRYGNNNLIYDQFNNQIWIYKYSTDKTLGMGIRFENNQRGLNICSNIINIAKENSDNLYYITNQNNNSDVTVTYSEKLYGNKYCKKDNLCLSKLTLVDIENTCNFCKEKNCTLYIHWY